MTKNELKKIIKETVKECIKEVLLDDKIFSTIIREVIQNTKEMVLEQNQHQEVIYQQPPMVAQVAQQQPRQRRSLSEIGGIDLPTRSRDRFEINESSQIRNQPLPASEVIKKDDSEAFSYATQMADGINTVPLNTIMYLLKGRN